MRKGWIVLFVLGLVLWCVSCGEKAEEVKELPKIPKQRVKVEEIEPARHSIERPLVTAIIYKGEGYEWDECILHPLVIDNPGTEPIYFDRIRITYKRDPLLYGSIIAQDIYWYGQNRCIRNYMEGMSPEEMKIPDDVQLVEQKVAGRSMQLHWYVQISGDFDGVNKPTAMTITLYKGEQQIGSSYTALLPKRSTLIPLSDVSIPELQSGVKGYKLQFTCNSACERKGENLRKLFNARR